ncbi:MAG: chromosomal replication initiator protein DnaA [Chloroflexi bacterium]|nr:chromosomal replication initiator protein DnaA [Chloroflexota bacterium]|tara:strand:+ start:5201 stop:6568 length:1368 start_codon:yes stop_codon:yes gene_type:complete
MEDRLADTANRLWEAALGRIQLQIPRPTYDTWLRNTHALRLDETQITVSVPSAFAAEWIESRLQKLLYEALSAVSHTPLSIRFVVGDDSSSAQAPIGKEAALSSPETLISSYTFDNFIVGPSNQLAYAAAYAVANNSPSAYNPLFLYGGVGLGKTHLMHGIGNLASLQGQKILLVSAEQFTNEYLRAIRDRKTEAFRNRYSHVDILLIDDIQFFYGKEATQEGLFHLFNEVYRKGGRLVMSSDRPAGELKLLEARLRSRFEAGLQADLSSPEYETRLAMLSAFAKTAQIQTPIAPEYLAFLANHNTDNVRTLQGVLNRFLAYIEFTNQAPSFDLAKIALGPLFLNGAETNFNTASVLESTSAICNLSVKILISSQRTKEASIGRQLAAYLMYVKLGLSPEEIGKILGNRDRSTITYAINRAKEALSTDSNFAHLLELVEKNIRESTKQVNNKKLA